MEAAIFIARIFSILYLVAGTGMLLNRAYYRRVLVDFGSSTGVILFSGIFALVIGTVIVLVHPGWRPDWTSLITFFGWAGIVKGAWLLVFPGSVARFMAAYTKNTALLTVHAAAAFILGIVMAYFGFFRPL